MRLSLRSKLTFGIGATVLVVTAVQVPLAHGVAQSCQGAAATVVGDPGESILTGTEGADVIVSNGSTTVRALGGDDLICLTKAKSAREVVFAFAGDGNDRVYNLREGRTTQARVSLDNGDDTYVGSPGKDSVGYVTDFGVAQIGLDIDTITTGAGHDKVATGVWGDPNRDVVKLGSGKDQLRLLAVDNTKATLDAGSGSDVLDANFGEMAPATGGWDLDNARGTARLGGVPMVSWAGLEAFDLTEFQDGEHATTFTGSAIDEHISISVVDSSEFNGTLDAHMGGGADVISTTSALPVAGALRSTFDGGAGRDRVESIPPFTETTQAVTGDLRRGLFVVEEEGARVGAAALVNIEDLDFNGREITLIGDTRTNQLTLTGCDLTANGRGGDDRILRTLGAIYGQRGCLQHLRPSNLAGGPGNDLLIGNDFKDHLIGGPGRDVARGGRGQDRCRAEAEMDCERN